MENSLALVISTARKNKNYTLSKLSRETQTSISYLCDIEHGRKSPSIATLSRIIKVLNIPSDKIFQ